MKSVALVLEFGGHLPKPENSQALAATIERQVAARPYRAALRVAAAGLAIISLSALILVAPIRWEAMGNYGYLGVFVATLVTTGALVLPIPYLAVIYEVASYLNPLAVALVAGVASAIGELTGYWLGYSGRELVDEARWERGAERWMRKHGFWSITVFAFIPNPAFDAAGIAAGALRYPIWKFALACFVGKTAKFLLVPVFGDMAEFIIVAAFGTPS
jgi:membrane protein YqaA with SNARE-associated domain